MERTAELPTQLQMHLAVMLPKNQKLERPITLTSTLWRLWRRLRKPLLDQWQQNLPPSMSHDRARPGANVLHVALERLRQEVTKARQQHGITVLMDMSTFYDTINLRRLQEEAIGLDYPPLMLELAMQLYCGPKAILAEQELTPFFHVDHGVPAGCPQATIAYLLEWKWQVQDIHRWHRPGSTYLLEQELTLQEPWWKLERALRQEAKAQRIARLASKPNHQHLVAGIDWHVYRQVFKSIPGENKPHLRTWTQAALHYKEDGKAKECPICKVPATTKHILWLRKWHQTQKHKPMPPEWAERILSDDETPSWTAGWIPLEPQEAKNMLHPNQGHGAHWRHNPIKGGLSLWMPHLPAMTSEINSGSLASAPTPCPWGICSAWRP